MSLCPRYSKYIQKHYNKDEPSDRLNFPSNSKSKCVAFNKEMNYYHEPIFNSSYCVDLRSETQNEFCQPVNSHKRNGVRKSLLDKYLIHEKTREIVTEFLPLNCEIHTDLQPSTGNSKKTMDNKDFNMKFHEYPLYGPRSVTTTFYTNNAQLSQKFTGLKPFNKVCNLTKPLPERMDDGWTVI